MELVINPGTFGINDASEEHAIENMRVFVSDIGKRNFVRLPDFDYGEGRYCFLVWDGNRCHEVQMPGWPLERVRYMNNEGQNPWHYPRLYLDDSSWLWIFAVDLAFDEDDEADE